MESNPDILDNVFERPEEEIRLVAASKGKRFLNYLIDYLVVFLFSIGGFTFMDAMGILPIDRVNDLTARLIGVLLYFLYYIILESSTGGKTIGKYFTGTRAVTKTGYLPTGLKFAGRSAARLIPFEPLSFLGTRGWHDSMTNTMVIDERQSHLT